MIFTGLITTVVESQSNYSSI